MDDDTLWVWWNEIMFRREHGALADSCPPTLALRVAHNLTPMVEWREDGYGYNEVQLTFFHWDDKPWKFNALEPYHR